MVHRMLCHETLRLVLRACGELRQGVREVVRYSSCGDCWQAVRRNDQAQPQRGELFPFQRYRDQLSFGQLPCEPEACIEPDAHTTKQKVLQDRKVVGTTAGSWRF